MTASILDGKPTAAAGRADLKQRSENSSVPLCHTLTNDHAPHGGRADVVGGADVLGAAGSLVAMPGDVGPMTPALLLTNVVEAAERAAPGM